MKDIRQEIQSSIPKRPILKPQELVKLGIGSSSTLVSWRKQGIGPRWFKFSDRCYGYLREDVIEWLMKNVGGNHDQAL